MQNDLFFFSFFAGSLILEMHVPNVGLKCKQNQIDRSTHSVATDISGPVVETLVCDHSNESYWEGREVPSLLLIMLYNLVSLR